VLLYTLQSRGTLYADEDHLAAATRPVADRSGRHELPTGPPTSPRHEGPSPNKEEG